MALTNLREWKIFPKWVDSLSIIRGNDGFINGIGGAVDAVVNQAKHYVFSDAGAITHEYDAPFPATAECGLSNIIPGCLIVIGGTTSREIWKFDPTVAGYTSASWTQLNSDFAADLGGDRTMAAFIDGGDGFHYIIGGWGHDTYQRTSDFVTFSSPTTLPTDLKKLSACAYFTYNGLIWLVGGMLVTGTDLYNGVLNPFVYSLDPGTLTFTQVHSDIVRFGNIWLDGASTDTHMYISKGFIPAEQIPVTGNGSAERGNQRGFMRSTDGITWEDISLIDGLKTYFERHRTGICKKSSSAVMMIAGYNANGVWEYQE